MIFFAQVDHNFHLPPNSINYRPNNALRTLSSNRRPFFNCWTAVGVRFIVRLAVSRLLEWNGVERPTTRLWIKFKVYAKWPQTERFSFHHFLLLTFDRNYIRPSINARPSILTELCSVDSFAFKLVSFKFWRKIDFCFSRLSLSDFSYTVYICVCCSFSGSPFCLFLKRGFEGFSINCIGKTNFNLSAFFIYLHSFFFQLFVCRIHTTWMRVWGGRGSRSLSRWAQRFDCLNVKPAKICFQSLRRSNRMWLQKHAQTWQPSSTSARLALRQQLARPTPQQLNSLRKLTIDFAVTRYAAPVVVSLVLLPTHTHEQSVSILFGKSTLATSFATSSQASLVRSRTEIHSHNHHFCHFFLCLLLLLPSCSLSYIRCKGLALFRSVSSNFDSKKSLYDFLALRVYLISSNCHFIYFPSSFSCFSTSFQFF